MKILPFTTWQSLHSSLHEASDRPVITHLTHVEDLVITDYVKGAQQAARMLSGLTAFFGGHANAPVNISVKIDGAPSIVAGNDPRDGVFFIGTKGAFAKTPRIAKSVAEIKQLYAGKDGLIDTMTVAFTALKKVWPTGKVVLQGDVLFTPALKTRQVIDGQNYITFKPNTIVYGLPAESDLGKQVIAAEFGVCFHTTYTGDTLETLYAAPGAITTGLKQSGAVVLFSSRYQDLSGTLTFTKTETTTLQTLLADIKSRTTKLSGNEFLSLLKSTPLLQSELMIFQNTLVRSGEPITLSPKMFVARFGAHLVARGQQNADTKRSDAGKNTTTQKYAALVEIVSEYEEGLVDILAWQHAATLAKTFMINKLNTVGALKTFQASDTGMVAGNHEGFVATDRRGNFVKLVDRMEFSRLNLTQGRFRSA